MSMCAPSKYTTENDLSLQRSVSIETSVLMLIIALTLNMEGINVHEPNGHILTF